jgi:hypothetical protein
MEILESRFSLSPREIATEFVYLAIAASAINCLEKCKLLRKGGCSGEWQSLLFLPLIANWFWSEVQAGTAEV